MSFADERKYIEERFNTNWGTTTPIAWENVSIDTPESFAKGSGNYMQVDHTEKQSSFVRLNILNGNSEYRSINKQTSKLHLGVIAVQVFIPLNGGTYKGREYADTIATIFDSASFNGIKCDVASIETVGSDGEYYQLNVNIPYRRDEG